MNGSYAYDDYKVMVSVIFIMGCRSCIAPVCFEFT